MDPIERYGATIVDMPTVSQRLGIRPKMKLFGRSFQITSVDPPPTLACYASPAFGFPILFNYSSCKGLVTLFSTTLDIADAALQSLSS